MSLKLFAIFTVFAIIARSSNGQVPLEQFLPFGQEHGDTVLVPSNGNQDDGSSSQVSLTHPFIFFSASQTSLYVNINGGVSFNGAISTYTPTCAPLTQAMSMIAPFWADVDLRTTTSKGGIYYRQSTDQGVLDKALVDIKAAFTNLPNTEAMKWAFIVTWNKVGFFGQNLGYTNKSNTFQMAMVTDGHDSFVIFNYNDIEWTTGTASNGDSEGLGGVPARAGFDNGQGKLTLLPGSCQADIINIASKKMGNGPGKFVFQVNGDYIIGPITGPTLQTVTDTVTREIVTHPFTETVSPDDIKKHKDELEQKLKVLRVRVLADCSKLIKRPALENKCYHELEKLDNLLEELQLTKFEDELLQIELEFEKIVDTMTRIEQDISLGLFRRK